MLAATMWPWRRELNPAVAVGDECGMFLEDGEDAPRQQKHTLPLKATALATAVGLVALGIWLRSSPWGSPEQTGATRASVELDAQMGEEQLRLLQGRNLLSSAKPATARAKPVEACHTAVKGETCYRKIMYGMQEGIHEHPLWYPGLDEFSSFEDFQNVLHTTGPGQICPKPCACNTAKEGDRCYSDIKWVLHTGIRQHPEWYPTISVNSRWEEVQARLTEDENNNCDKPCPMKVLGSPSLFCFSIFRSQGYELGLVRSQVEKGVGIFGCDEFAVLSDKELAVTATVKTLIIPPCEKVGVSKDGTAANAQIFMNAWKVIHKNMKYRPYDWVIKADPDAVIIVDRLRHLLAAHTGKKVFMQNCAKYKGPGWPMMYGSLEAFSHLAIEAYFAEDGRCTKGLNWTSWGEDLFMNNCLKLKLDVKAEYDEDLISDEVCEGHGDCSDGRSAAYHPFKSPEAWFKCYKQVNDINYFNDDEVLVKK